MKLKQEAPDITELEFTQILTEGSNRIILRATRMKDKHYAEVSVPKFIFTMAESNPGSSAIHFKPFVRKIMNAFIKGETKVCS